MDTSSTQAAPSKSLAASNGTVPVSSSSKDAARPAMPSPSQAAVSPVASSSAAPSNPAPSASSSSSSSIAPSNVASPSSAPAKDPKPSSSDAVDPVLNLALTVPAEEEALSYVNQEGDWKYKKINLFSVLRGFVSQLKPGQDLTKVSLPAEVCTPYGLLEVMGSRELAMFHLLFGMNNHPESPVERFLAALRFFFGTVRTERFDKKPWNPVLGETHITWVETFHSEDGNVTTETAQASPSSSNSNKAQSRSTFVGEQVSHHPPISAFSLNNPREDVTCNANISFTVRFGGNQVTVATAGAMQMTSKRFNETYELTKCLPDMVIRNVVWGKKYIMWEGEVQMTCAATGLTAYLKFKEKSHVNVVKGYVCQGDQEEPLIEIHGVCGEKIMYNYAGHEKEPKVLLDLTKENLARIRYLPKSKLDPLSSVRVWDAVNRAIVEDDIPRADKEKKLIEQAQRERSKARAEAKQEYSGCYFDMSPDGMWMYKGNMDLENILFHSDSQVASPSEVLSEAQSEEYEDVLDDLPSDQIGSLGINGSLSDIDRSPIASGDEFDMEDDSGPSHHTMITSSAPSSLDVTSSNKRRRASSSKSSMIVQPTSTTSKKELRAEKKKAREEVKMVYSKIKEEKKKNSGVINVHVSQQVYAGWAKMRNSFKQWKERWVVLQSGRLIYFRNQSDVGKESCLGIVLLNGCDVRPRPSKKEGACFKIYSLRQYPIYSKQGLKGETISSALLPVGSDYAILRCEESKLQTWIEKIRQCIPDWERNKPLIKSAASEFGDSEGDSDDESEESDAEASNTLEANPTHSSENLAASNIHLGEVHKEAVITNNQIIEQIGQLYKITKKLATRHRKFAENMDEFRTKVVPESLAEIKKSIQSGSAPLAKKSPFAKSESKPKGIVNKLRSVFDLKTIILLLIIIVLVYYLLVAQSDLAALKASVDPESSSSIPELTQ